MTSGFLLDTHALLWALDDDKRLSGEARQRLNSGAPLYVSIASLWEIAIKASLGKMREMPPEFDAFLTGQGFTLLPLRFSHMQSLQKLPLYHRDPFDRMLVAQTQAENLVFMTNDRNLLQYGIALVTA